MSREFRRLVQRDKEIFKLLFQYRFLTTDQMAKYFGVTPGQDQSLGKRLIGLAKAGFVDRLSDLALPCWALSDGGADYLPAYEDLMPKKETWATKNRRLKPTAYSPHDMALNSFLLSWAKQGVLEEGSTYVPQTDLANSLFLGSKKERLKWCVDIRWQNRDLKDVDIIPDQVTAMINPVGKTAYFFTELDMGTEQQALKRGKFLNSPTIMKKLLAYSETHRSAAVMDAYGFDNFRVLFVIKAGEGRRQNMIKLYQEYEQELGPANLFCFALLDVLEENGPMGEGVWVNALGTPICLGPDSSG